MNSKWLKILLLVLIVFFGLQLVSRSISVLAGRTEQAALQKIAAYTFPIEADAYYRYGHARYWEARKQSPANEALLKEAIHYLNKSLANNRFYYRPHFYLGRAYLFSGEKDATQKGLGCLRRAVHLQGGKDIPMTALVVHSMVGQWEQLTGEDKLMCRTMLKNIIRHIDSDNFEGILNAWEKNSRDIALFREALPEAPYYYRMVAGALARLEIEAQLRQIYMLNHEIYSLENIRQDYLNLKQRSRINVNRLMELRKRLKQNIDGYYRLVPDNRFKLQTHTEILNELNFFILENMLSQSAWKNNNDGRRQLERFIRECIEDLEISESGTGKEYEELFELLQKAHYFEPTDCRSQLIAQTINFHLQDYSAVIDGLQNLISSQAFMAESDKDIRTDLVLLLADAHIGSRLHTKALQLLSGTDVEQHRKMDQYIRILKIRNVIGEGSGKQDVKTRKEAEQPDLDIKKSRIIHLAGNVARSTVYFDNERQLEIHFTQTADDKAPTHHLLQVYANGLIVREYYLGTVKTPITVSLPLLKRFKAHKITIRLE